MPCTHLPPSLSLCYERPCVVGGCVGRAPVTMTAVPPESGPPVGLTLPITGAVWRRDLVSQGAAIRGQAALRTRIIGVVARADRRHGADRDINQAHRLPHIHTHALCSQFKVFTWGSQMGRTAVGAAPVVHCTSRPSRTTSSHCTPATSTVTGLVALKPAHRDRQSLCPLGRLPDARGRRRRRTSDHNGQPRAAGLGPVLGQERRHGRCVCQPRNP
jgi:hypothetical protein